MQGSLGESQRRDRQRQGVRACWRRQSRLPRFQPAALSHCQGARPDRASASLKLSKPGCGARSMPPNVPEQ
eukprot:1624528-Prymnesium_polylepis.1